VARFAFTPRACRAEPDRPALHDDFDLLAGVLLPAPRQPPEVARVATAVAERLAGELPDHRVIAGARVALGDVDALRLDVVVARPLAGPHAWALAVFVGADEGPLRWRAHRCARAGVLEVWTIAPPARMGWRWRAPAAGGYLRRDPLPPGALVAPDAAPERRFVAWALGP
jgi:hypothetical protein